MHERFTGGEIVPWQDLEFELVSEGASRNRALLDQLKNEVLHIAAVARGWHEPADFAFFERAFKIGPLYEVEALALVRRGGKLVGLAGSVNDWRLAEGSAIVHLCSLGLLPEVQARGILPVLMALLWRASLQRPAIAEAYRQGRVYATAISQSPYIVWFLSQLAEVFPAPDRPAPSPEELAVARAVVARFDPHLELDEAGFVLREECEFRYRYPPLSPDRRINRFCRERLREEEGDVFVLVGRVKPERLEAFLARVERAYGELFESLAWVVEERPENLGLEREAS